MRVLIFGGMGMLGHKLAQVFAARHETIVAIRGDGTQWPSALPVARVAGNVDVKNVASLMRTLDECRPDAVLNAVGVIKQIMKGRDPAETVEINALYPNLLAGLCRDRGIRLVHYSTDCVFTGAPESERGPAGYRESDLPDARDLYGMSKFLGEPPAPCLTLRTSIIGLELRGHYGLVDWFLSQRAAPVAGYTKALFTGFPTIVLAQLTETILTRYSGLEGLWQVAAPPIDKYSLLRLVKTAFGRETPVDPDDRFFCDRRLDGSRFSEETGWISPSWPELVQAMRDDPYDYGGARASA